MAVSEAGFLSNEFANCKAEIIKAGSLHFFKNIFVVFETA
jgi:hypothetical protein